MSSPSYVTEDPHTMSPGSTSSSSLSVCMELSANMDKPLPPPPSSSTSPNPTRSLSATTLTMRTPPSGGGSQTKRHSVRSQHGSSSSLDRSISQPPQRPTSPITSPSIHKSLTALDAKSIARDMEKSAFQLRTDDVISPTSPNNTSTLNPNNFYFSSNQGNMSFQSMAAPSTTTPSLNHLQYHRQNSMSSITLPSVINSTVNNTVQGDAWQTLCVRVLPLFNGEGVQGAIEDLNELLRRCLSDSITPKFYRDIEALLRDGMFTLNAKMFGVTDEKLLDRLVEQWSFFFTYALPYFEAVFLPLRTDVRYRSPDEAEMWNVRNMALRSFRDNVILLQTKRLEDVFNKLFTDFGSSQNPAATAAKMLQMTSLLASSPDHNEDIERVLSNLKANWKIMMTKGDRRGFAGVRKMRPLNGDNSNQMFGTIQQ
ncbi:HbrB-like-domain-containing protein [Helicostylum pulchrum]|nr:HbrB-like-domain-containing protein [Helicostylum pulchrum]